MRDATIATSRTRADHRPLIDYRPAPAAWGDVDALRRLRDAKARAEQQGEDPSLLRFSTDDPAAVTGRGSRTDLSPRAPRRTVARHRRPGLWRGGFQFASP